jgi:hypothetical protein
MRVMGDAARKWATGAFPVSSMVASTLQLYEVLENGAAPEGLQCGASCCQMALDATPISSVYD